MSCHRDLTQKGIPKPSKIITFGTTWSNVSSTLAIKAPSPEDTLPARAPKVLTWNPFGQKKPSFLTQNDKKWNAFLP